jgi:hypothetical protein
MLACLYVCLYKLTCILYFVAVFTLQTHVYCIGVCQAMKSWTISETCDSGGQAGSPGPDYSEHVPEGRSGFLDNSYREMKAHAMFLSGAHIMALKDTCIAVINENTVLTKKEPAVSLFEASSMDEFIGNCRMIVNKV